MPQIPTFLVVDDDGDARYLAAHKLRRAFPGARVIECNSPLEAMKIAKTTKFDGIVTDHHLGSADGVSLIRDLRGCGATCPIVMATASSDPRVRERAYAAGAAHVFAEDDNDFVAFFRLALNDSSSEARSKGASPHIAP